MKRKLKQSEIEADTQIGEASLDEGNLDNYDELV
jgi:hypothetical protein